MFVLTNANWKRLALLAGAVAAIAVLVWPLFWSKGIDHAKVYRIGYGGDPPFHFQGPNGQPAGMAVQLVSEAARRKGIQLQWIETNGISGLDLWVLLTIRPERLSRFHITEPYLETETCFVIPDGGPIHELKDLAASRISHVDYDIHKKNLALLLPNMKPVPVQNSLEAVVRMAGGLADAAYVDQYAVLPALQSGKIAIATRIMPSNVPKGLMGIGATFDCAAVADEIRDGMRSMADDGSVASIVSQWGLFPRLTTDMVGELINAQRRIRWLAMASVALSVLLLLTIWLAARLQRQKLRSEKAERDFRASEERFKLSMEATNDGLWDWNIKTNDGYFSPGYYRMLGCEVGAFPASGDSWSRLIHPEDLDATLRAHRECIEGRCEHFEIEYRMKSKNDEWRWILGRGKCVERDDKGRALRMVGTHVDMTERKRLDEKLRQAQKMESIGQLAGGVAHDFNNILAATMMQLSFLRLNPRLDLETQNSIKELMDDANRAANLTRQLLMFSRRSVFNVKVLDLNIVVADLLKMLVRLIGENIVVRFNQCEALPVVEADLGMIEQVVMNLALNARDAMPQGGSLSIALEPVQVDEKRVPDSIDTPPGLFVCLSVADTGCGMDETTLKRIFEPFFTTKDVGKGTGLGLATVHGIVAQHKGWIEVESQPGNGATFKVFLPASLKTKDEPRSRQITAEIQGRETILIVEDEDGLRKSVAKGLRHLGYSVLEAGDGQAAMKVWQEQGPHIDLLFSDMVMPGGLSGMDLAKRLKKDKPSLKVIICSGYNMDFAGQSTPATEDFAYCQKPYEFEVLSRSIRNCLDYTR